MCAKISCTGCVCPAQWQAGSGRSLPETQEVCAGSSWPLAHAMRAMPTAATGSALS